MKSDPFIEQIRIVVERSHARGESAMKLYGRHNLFYEVSDTNDIAIINNDEFRIVFGRWETNLKEVGTDHWEFVTQWEKNLAREISMKKPYTKILIHATDMALEKMVSSKIQTTHCIFDGAKTRDTQPQMNTGPTQNDTARLLIWNEECAMASKLMEFILNKL